MTFPQRSRRPSSSARRKKKSSHRLSAGGSCVIQLATFSAFQMASRTTCRSTWIPDLPQLCGHGNRRLGQPLKASLTSPRPPRPPQGQSPARGAPDLAPRSPLEAWAGGCGYDPGVYRPALGGSRRRADRQRQHRRTVQEDRPDGKRVRLVRMVRTRALVSVTLGGDRYSAGYSASGGLGLGRLVAGYRRRPVPSGPRRGTRDRSGGLTRPLVTRATKTALQIISGEPFCLVAGAGFEPVTFPLGLPRLAWSR